MKIARTKAEATAAAKFDTDMGVLMARSIDIKACDCCGDVMVILRDPHDRPFAVAVMPRATAEGFHAQLSGAIARPAAPVERMH